MSDEPIQLIEEKVSSLYKFIKELILLKSKTVLNINDYDWHKSFNDIPEDEENIHIFYKDYVSNDDTESPVLLSVHKPDFENCPQPDKIFRKWIDREWYSYKVQIKNIDYKIFNKIGIECTPEEKKQIEESEAGESVADKLPAGYSIEYFEDNADRVEAYKLWSDERDAWQKRQITINNTRRFFIDLYQQYINLTRDSELLEMVVVNGFIKAKNMPEINQAVLTRRVKISLDAMHDIITIEDTDDVSDLYSALFQEMQDVNLDNMGLLREKISINDYHPLDRNETPDYLKEIVHYLSGESLFSENGIPDNWDANHELLMYLNPTLVVRKRQNGSPQAIEAILQNIENGGFIPSPLKEIVGGGLIEVQEDNYDLSIQEQLAEVGGESVDVLLSKEANKEQLDIARRIENYNAVLVQGPPGTGKTHTIANLMGHFLAQGKTVLVTSQTKKALSVLKEKIDEGLQTLCVSVLDDSNLDMEKAVDGIAEHMSAYTSSQLLRMMGEKAQQRGNVISELADLRVKLFDKLKCEYSSIQLDGSEITPIDAAKFVLDNEQELSYIPGKVKFIKDLPLSIDELNKLYRSSAGISELEEEELSKDLPDPQQLLSPIEFATACEQIKTATGKINQIAKEHGWSVSTENGQCNLGISRNLSPITLTMPAQESKDSVSDTLSSLSKLESWMIPIITAGHKGGPSKQRWEMLIGAINDVCIWDESIDAERFGKIIEFKTEDIESLKDGYEKLIEKKSKPNKIQRKLDRKLDDALSSVSIDGSEPETVDDFILIKHFIDRQLLRNKCGKYWNELFKNTEFNNFYALNETEPEIIAKNWIEQINWCLSWFENDYSQIQRLLSELGISEQLIFPRNKMASEDKYIEDVINIASTCIPDIIKIAEKVAFIFEEKSKLESEKRILTEGSRYSSQICKDLMNAVSEMNPEAYQEGYHALQMLFAKYELKNNRENWLDRIYDAAPDWADAIRNRTGIHGSTELPENIEDAWKWKQLNAYLANIADDSVNDLQKKSLELSRMYREVTADYSRCSAWYHLIKRTEENLSLKQNLQGWKQTVRAIGKGTGKRAPALKKEAREIMAKCQEAVPAWIMPINKALESFNPAINSFDVVIIDEASQADLSALAILYMGKKLIIVGDDKQVSPISIGQQTEKIEALQNEYIKGKIPNGHLYDGNRSIYDVAMTTFQPLMLKEHFRCVPDIIGFSNLLSYDFKIKPLRDAGTSKLLPAIVNHRVKGGTRDGFKTNSKEAKEIICLLKSCMEQPEYNGKTFGIISLLGNDQAKLIQSMIFENFEPGEIEERRMLCGDAASFQGDERDVIFLSLVDSNEDEGPLTLKEFGAGEELRKRYNVATSRARDQLWVVHSLDPAHDLKPRDIRKRLIDYATNPKSIEYSLNMVEKGSESPFEESVAKALIARGYDIQQQYPVGAYRLDIVVKDKTKNIVIECDGERFHSGEDKIREDMERQTILERIGWRFIRIRGSEYYRNPDKTMEKVFDQLSELEVEPVGETQPYDEYEASELLSRVLNRADELKSEINPDSKKEVINIATIGAALNPKSSFGGNKYHAKISEDYISDSNLSPAEQNVAARENSNDDSHAINKSPMFNDIPQDNKDDKNSSVEMSNQVAEDDSERKAKLKMLLEDELIKQDSVQVARPANSPQNSNSIKTKLQSLLDE